MSETSLTYGLNSGGFVRMRLPEIRQLILAELKTRTGYDFDDSPDSFTGQLIAIFAERLAALWELAELAYLSPYPVTAQGISLDLAVSYAGVRRLEPARSRADVYVLGAPGTVVPAGTVIQALVASDNADTPPRFFLQYDVTCTKSKSVGAQLTVIPPVVAGTQYWVEIAGVRRTYVAIDGQTPTQVATAIDGMLGNLSTSDGATVTIFNPTEFIIDFSPIFQVNYVASMGVVLSEAFGPIVADERTIRRVLNAPLGVVDIYNPYPAVPGQTEETDAALRLRYNTGVYQLGAATAPSIDANIKENIKGVSSVKLLVNENDGVDANGLPGHSIELIIEGGDDQAIFNEIHAVKAAGITSVGNLGGTVQGDDGFAYPVRFSRPEIQWVWLRVVYSTNPEESVPGDIAGQIVEAILSEGATFSPGQDVILQRLQAAPFQVTAIKKAIKSLTVTAKITAMNAAAPVLPYNAADISINPRQKASFDISRIIVG